MECKTDWTIAVHTKRDAFGKWIRCFLEDFNRLPIQSNFRFDATWPIQNRRKASIGSTHPHALDIGRQHAIHISRATRSHKLELWPMIAVRTVQCCSRPLEAHLAGVARNVELVRAGKVLQAGPILSYRAHTSVEQGPLDTV